MTRTFFALLLVTVPILSAGQSDAPVRRPEIRVGDSWTYRGTNMIAPGTHEYESRVSFVDDEVIVAVSTRKSDGQEFDASWTREWNWVTPYSRYGYRPHMGVLRFPLRVGDEHSIKYEVLAPRVNTVAAITTGKATVAGWETVEVPAGKFRALKVEVEAMVQPSGVARAHQLQGAIWYAPEVRRGVKLRFVNPQITVSEELLEYKLNKN